MESSPSIDPSRWLFRYAALTAAATLGLIAMGGLVTSHGVGLAVPDWPTTYGYNMFLFPISQWKGGIFYEHSHRLLASLVGMLTTVLAVWVWLKEKRRWLRWAGVAAFGLVVAQGILGGLRVVWLMDEIGVVHAALAQVFLVLLSGVALGLSPAARRWEAEQGGPACSASWRFWVILGTVLIFAQLILGATMRHQHAGLAVPDFPLAYGQWWPPMDAASIEAINRSRLDARDYSAITAFHIGLHMAHRVGALILLVVVGWAVRLAGRGGAGMGWARRMTRLWFGLMLMQAAMGVATVWSNKAADVATVHVVLGALSLVTGSLLCMVGLKFSVDASQALGHSRAMDSRRSMGESAATLTVPS